MNPNTNALKAALRKAEPDVRSAAYVARLLRIQPAEPFPLGAESSDEANQHLIEFIVDKLETLLDSLDATRDGTGRFALYELTLLRCVSVACGEVKPPRSEWNEKNDGCRRGIYQKGGRA
jgi:hypothetical protein